MGSGSYLLLEIFSMLLMAGSFALLVPRGLAYPADEALIGDAEPLAYPISEANTFQQMAIPPYNNIDKPKSCFHFYVSRNMSSLLSDATKMLQQVHDRREREWILTFIYRIKSLAEHLRTHPESRNYECLTSDDENRRRTSSLSDHLRIPQQELYFVDDMLPPYTNQKRGVSSSNKDPDSTQNMQESQSVEPAQDSQNIADNQNSQQSSTSAWKEESMSYVALEKDSENFNSIAPESSSKLTQEREGQVVDPVPPEAAAVSSDHGQQDKDTKSSPQNQVVNPGHTEKSSGDKRPYDNVIVISSPPDCEANKECEKALNRQIAAGSQVSTAGQKEDLIVQQLHSRQHQKNIEEDRIQQKVLKKRIRKALLEEMAPEVKKLRTVGGSEDDLINLWKQSETESGKSTENSHDGDFDYEEIGAAAGDLSSNDRYTTSDHTVAPSLGEMKNFKRQSNAEGGTKAYEPYDDSDVLVKQLFDVRFEQAPSKTTKSLNEPREEYLITSTHIPY